MGKYNYLHLFSDAREDSKSEISNDKVYPPILSNVGLEFDRPPKEDIFTSGTEIICSDRLRKFLDELNVSGVQFDKIDRFSYSLNMQANYPEYDIQQNVFYPFWLCNCSQFEIEGRFIFYQRKYLLIEDNLFIKLKSRFNLPSSHELIDIEIDDYINSDRKYFWLSEPSRSNHIKAMKRAKKPMSIKERLKNLLN